MSTEEDNMSYNGLPFPAEYPGAIVVPVHSSNVMRDRLTGEIKPINKAKVLVIHTPEEPADDYESTPRYFADPNRNASTHFYTDSDGDMYQLLPVRFGAIANGVRNKPYPAGTDPTINLNYQSESNEVEGYAASMHRTCPPGSRQFNSARTWIVQRSLVTGIAVLEAGHVKNIDRVHVIGHYEVADNRTDPGTLKLDQLVMEAAEVADALARAPRLALANAALRRALEPAWDRMDWAFLHKQLHAVGVPVAP